MDTPEVIAVCTVWPEMLSPSAYAPGSMHVLGTALKAGCELSRLPHTKVSSIRLSNCFGLPLQA